MRRLMFVAVFLLFPTLVVPTFALSPDEESVHQQAIAVLEQRIREAEPREQCFLYAQLINQMTEFSRHQYAAGNSGKANALLHQVQGLTQKLHKTVSENDKRLKKAEILLRRTAFRLNEMLHASSYPDRTLLQETLAQVNQADNDAMLQVFKR
ncbi:MAG TPA: hypothetical protein VMV57_08500 [Terracidiphilus sp.]|nr:hypothetical protein [Terracidiphilus sp.]